MTQFFQLFPNLADNDFYITGESYAGKYIPSFGYKIHTMNMDASNARINLVGLSIGDGMMDPLTQTQGYADLMFQMGLMDEQEVAQGRVYENKMGKDPDPSSPFNESDRAYRVLDLARKVLGGLLRL